MVVAEWSDSGELASGALVEAQLTSSSWCVGGVAGIWFRYKARALGAECAGTLLTGAWHESRLRRS